MWEVRGILAHVKSREEKTENMAIILRAVAEFFKISGKLFEV